MPEETNKNPLLIASYEKLDGTACFAPYVQCVASSLLRGRSVSESAEFKMRVDTGADYSCVPQKHTEHLGSLLAGETILSRLGDGKVRRVKLKLVTISIMFSDGDSKSYRPSRGVLLCKGDYGLLGMDILNSLDVRVCNQRLYISPVTGGDGHD